MESDWLNEKQGNAEVEEEGEETEREEVAIKVHAQQRSHNV